MNSFTDPPQDFNHESYTGEIAAITMNIRNNKKISEARFNAVYYDDWTWILGRPLCSLFSVMCHNFMGVVREDQKIVPGGFLKAFQCSVDGAYIKRIAATSRNIDSASSLENAAATCVTSLYYVGTKSYTWGSDINIDGVPAMRHRNLVVSVDLASRQPGELNESWRSKSHQFMESINRPNERMLLPEFPKDGLLLFSFSTKVHENHIDLNGHANYKFYIFGAIVCLRLAIEGRKVEEFHNSNFSELVVRELVCIFEKECLPGKEVTFDLVASPDGSFFVASYTDDSRLSYVQLNVVDLKSYMHKL